MFKFFQKLGPAVGVVGANVVLAVASELLLRKEEQAYRERGLPTHRVWKTTNATSAFVSVEVAPKEVARTPK